MDLEHPVSAPERWRVVVFTNLPGGGVYTLLDGVMRQLGHAIVGVVTTPGPKRRRSRGYLDVVATVRPGVDVLVSNHPERWAAMLAPLRPDLIISGSFPWRIPIDVLALPRLGAINVHPALLPKYRGPNSIQWALRNGDRELGMTVHRTAFDFDTGPILAQGSVTIGDDERGDVLLGRLLDLAPGLVRQALERIARGEPGEPQDEAQASYAGLFEDAWRRIDWSRPAREIHNQVRSWSLFGDGTDWAEGDIDGAVLQIGTTRLLSPEETLTAVPGTVLQREGNGLVVQCGDGPIEIVAWNPVAAGPETDSSAPA
ncbi:MAG: methionyl-tRNA formyltransferase [Chloroflexi bacterium]|nr:methionyl-tRNA formyltransferase [Chloroflexota bacterium]